MNINEQLVEYGLSEREALVYTFLLGRIEAPAFKIAKGTGIPRATVYLTLEELKRKGLVSSSRKNNIAYFLAESPNRLKKIVQEKLSLTELLIPQLRSLVDSDRFSPAMKIYEGKKGLKIVFDDMLETIEQKNLKELHVVTNAELLETLPKYLPNWVSQREKLGVFTYMIAETSNGHVSFDTNKLREVRHFPPHVAFDCSIDIYGDKIACISTKDNEIYGAIIESRTIVNTIRQLFFTVWDALEKKGPQTHVEHKV